MKTGNRNFLEPSGPLQTCNGTAIFSKPIDVRLTDFHVMTSTLRYKDGPTRIYRISHVKSPEFLFGWGLFIADNMSQMARAVIRKSSSLSFNL